MTIHKKTIFETNWFWLVLFAALVLMLWTWA